MKLYVGLLIVAPIVYQSCATFHEGKNTLCCENKSFVDLSTLEVDQCISVSLVEITDDYYVVNNGGTREYFDKEHCVLIPEDYGYNDSDGSVL